MECRLLFAQSRAATPAGMVAFLNCSALAFSQQHIQSLAGHRLQKILPRKFRTQCGQLSLLRVHPRIDIRRRVNCFDLSPVQGMWRGL